MSIQETLLQDLSIKTIIGIALLIGLHIYSDIIT